MNRTKRNREPGTVVLMAVGILMMLAMVGTTYIIVSHLDQRESASVAGQVPLGKVASGVFNRAKAVLVEDLRVWTQGQILAGATSDHPFERPDNWWRWVDDDSQFVDPWLAAAVPQGGAYPHVTDLYGGDRNSTYFNDVARVAAPADGGPIKDGQGRWLVDADGDGLTDSILVPTGLRDEDGNYFFVAARVIDLSALLDLRVVGEPSNPEPFFSGTGTRAKYFRDAFRGCPVTDLAWSRMGTALPFADPTSKTGLHYLRSGPYEPTLKEYNNASVRKFRNMMALDNYQSGVCNFGQDDLLSLLWRESNTARRMRGRLYENIGPADYISKRHLWTTESASRNLLGRVPTGGTDDDPTFTYDWADLHARVDVNQAIRLWDTGGKEALFWAVYNAIPRDKYLTALPAGVFGFDASTLVTNAAMDRFRMCLAAQYVVNLKDFADADKEGDGPDRDLPTFLSQIEDLDKNMHVLVDGNGQALTVCGIERQLFITEVYHKKTQDVGDLQPQQYCAIELFNPYATPIDVSDYRVKCGSADVSLAGLVPGGVAPGGRLVLVNDVADITPIPLAAGVTPVKVQGLDLDDTTNGVEIVRVVGGNTVYIGGASLRVADPNPDDTSGTAVKERYIVARRDDAPARARYTLAQYEIDPAYGSDSIDPTRTAGTSLGAPNNVAEGDEDFKAYEPTPVYVRNGGFLNFGDLLRAFYIGPGAAPLDVQLKAMMDLAAGAQKLAVGRWDLPADPTQIAYRWYGSDDNELEADVCRKYVPPLPVACLLTGTLTINNPCNDGVDNNRKGVVADKGVDEATESAIYGMVNINTAPIEVIKCLVPIWNGYQAAPDAGANVDLIAQEIDNYRQTRTYAVSGEVFVPVMTSLLSQGLLVSAYAGTQANPAVNYKVGDAGASDDGLCWLQPPNTSQDIVGDLAKYQAIYSRMGNLVTVRSDSFAVYVTAMRFRPSQVEKTDSNGNPTPDLRYPTAVRRYVGVIDRSECYKRGDWPETRMFAEIK